MPSNSTMTRNGLRWVFGAALALSCGASARAQPTPPAAAAKAEAPTLRLSECLAIGLERRPAVRAAQASHDAAVLNYQGIDRLPGYAGLARPDLATRKRQSLQSITVAQAGVERARHDATYDITRTYYTAVYARQQEGTAAAVLADLESFAKVVDQVRKFPLRDPKSKLNAFTAGTIQDRISEVRLSALKAEQGRRQALLALKEAMGGDFDRDFAPRDAALPFLEYALAKETVVDLAMSRRPELVMAAAGSEAFRLEVCAQMKARGLLAETFASGRDIHAAQIPPAQRDAEYKPGGVPPELPVAIVGRRDDRAARAAEFSRRADAAATQVANLVRLDAENTFVAWEVSTRRVAEAKKRADNARKTAADARVAALAQMDAELMMTHATTAGRSSAEYAEAVFEHLKTLAALERATGGGLRPAFPGR